MVCVLHSNVGKECFPASADWKKFWELENIGIVDDLEPPHNNSVLNVFKGYIARNEERYEVRLPWKATKTPLDTNFEVAKTRLKRLVRRLSENEELLHKYDKAIRSYIQDGHAEQVPMKSAECPAMTSERIYYMPHREVIKEQSSSTKIRIVFDASSHARACTSLNDHLEKGPKLHPDLLDVLVRFRMKSIGMTGDIQKAYLQIGVKEEDRDSLRFQWFDEISPHSAATGNIVEWRMTRVPFGTTASAFLLSATLNHHFANKGQRCLFCVSCDLVFGANSAVDALQLYNEARIILSSAKMELRKWSSNSPELREKFQQDGVSAPAQPFNSKIKVLGIVWNTQDDCLAVDIEGILSSVSKNGQTKRAVLQTLARIFDPLGLLNPFTIGAKTLFQDLWKHEVDWDEKIPEAFIDVWESWCQHISSISDVEVPRCISTPGGSYCQVHVFCDASKRAYGCAAYLRWVNDKGDSTARIICSKARVSPLKELTLPRLELMAAVIGIRMLTYLQRVFAFHFEYRMWSDSSIVLTWIRRSSRDWKTFVANRVQEIQSSSDTRLWRYCPSADNPADLLTRGIFVKKLASSDLWWRGPPWLSEDTTCWPDLLGESEDEAALKERMPCTANVNQ
ncbi:uncharacterized protein LOC135386067 [Ornithodoros turicata]|uniref:uncharacterized protein LOC135386067 n=1 Tax=Ornithodoros turicata TaxID=34597 RepID=UPI003139F1AF